MLELTGVRERARLRLRTLSWPLSARGAVAVLAGMAGLSIALRIGFGREVKGPFFFMDELGYEQMAKSLGRSGDLALFGKTGSAYAPLYSAVLAPVYALLRSGPDAYSWAKVVNAVLMSLSVFPVYGIARFVLSRSRALGVAALSLIAPLMFYTDLELSENLAYPLFLVAIWAMLRALRDPRPRNDALLLVSILLASAARLQHLVLLPATLTAILLVALIRPDPPGERRIRSAAQLVARHWLLFGGVAVALVAALAKTVGNGGALPLAGRYSVVGRARPDPVRVLEIAVQHFAEFDFALGIVPFAGALLAAYALARFGFPRRSLIFGSVAVSTTVWMLLEVAFDAAAFDTGVSTRHSVLPQGDLPRIHERYLIYLVPLFLVAMVAALRVARLRVGTSVHVAVAAVAALLPAAIPFSRVVNYTIVAESFGLQIFGTNFGGRIASISHAPLIALAVGGVFALGYLYALLRPRPSFAVVLTVIAFLMLSTLVRLRIVGAAETSYAAVPTHTDWIDRVVHTSDVVLIGGRFTHRAALRQRAALQDTAFTNLTISRVYYTCIPVFGTDFGERRIGLGSDGTLRDASGTVHASYAVAPARFGIRGHILGQDRKEDLVLVAPAGGVLRVPPANRPAAHCDG